MASLPMACLLPALGNGNPAIGLPDRVIGRGWASGLSHRVLQPGNPSQGLLDHDPLSPDRHPANLPTTAPLSLFLSGETLLSIHLTSPPCSVCTVLAFELLSKHPGSSQPSFCVWVPLRMTLTNRSDGERSVLKVLSYLLIRSPNKPTATIN